MSTWPYELSLDAFKKVYDLQGESFWLNVFNAHKEKMQIKNPAVAVVNLEKIFSATFKLANSKGFQTMSLRDLSRETEISMGGLYAYIGSKNDLASVIEGVLRTTIDQVIGSLHKQDLEPIHKLRAIVYGEIYTMEILKPWYYFCFMELKGLPREQQEQAMELELRFEQNVIDVIEAGILSGQFACSNPRMLAALVTAQLQQWHLKQWKFKQASVDTQHYARFVVESLLLSLQYQPLKGRASSMGVHQLLAVD
ncbi:MAG: TetR/AcrR family transcriptional regulator [Pseudohongiellaceae bacterium]